MTNHCTETEFELTTLKRLGALGYQPVFGMDLQRSHDQVDRFLFLLDLVYGGLPDNHTEANPKDVASAMIELQDNIGEYIEMEENEGMDWELA